MSRRREAHLREVRSYYAEVWLGRFVRGHNAESLAMHFGLSDSAGSDVQAAKRATNELVHRLLDALHARPACVADLGCGVGGSAIQLAEKEATWTLLGVNMAEDQIAFARAAAARSSARDRVRFVHADYAKLPFEDASIDAAFFLESACHALDRDELMREVARVLAPMGRVVVVDFARTELPLAAPEDRDAYASVCRGFCIPDYFDAPLEGLMLAAGLRPVDRVELTPRVRAGVERSAQGARGRAESTPLERLHAETLLGIDRLVKSRHLAYVATVAERPPGDQKAIPGGLGGQGNE